jgi:hypothetical protein
MAGQILPGTYKDFADFAARNGIRMQPPGMLTSNSDDVLVAAMASNAAIAATENPGSKVGYATALNQTIATATVVLGEQISAGQGVIKMFSFDDGKSEARSFDGAVTIGTDGRATIDMTAGVQHFYQTDEERNAYENLSAAFNRRNDIADLKAGPFAAFAQQKGLPVGGIDSPEGQYKIENAPGDGPRSLTSCAPLSPAFAVCASNVYSVPKDGDPTLTAKMQVMAIDGGAVAATGEAGMSRPMESQLGEFDRYDAYANQSGLKTFRPQ